LSRTGSGGGGATHLALSPDGTALFVANFGGAQVAVLPVAGDGAVAPFTSIRLQVGSGPHRRQQSAHPHGVTLDPSKRCLLAPDMGADRVFVYRYDAAFKTLAEAGPAEELPAGSGPRLILFGRDGRFAYLLTELSAELFVYRWDESTGGLTLIGRTPLDAPDADDDRSAAAITLSADGRFLYASNRTTNAIQAYAIDPETGLLSEVQRVAAGGAKPWHAEISPSGRWMVVANQGSNLLCAFAVDPDSGRLTAAGSGVAVPAPTGIAFT
jgi:6-phosphogluconolactonase